MRIGFEQLFYGRGNAGYGVLGVSAGGRCFAGRVEALCGGAGTPEGGYGGEPFLLSMPEGEWVIMACGRRGVPDSIGRATLFFHVLAARASELEKAGADAFSLFGQGAFAECLPEGEAQGVYLDVRPGGARPDGGGPAFPAAIRTEHPAPEVVRALVGDRANRLRWATYAFQPMPGSDIQVLPARTPMPRGANEYDGEGRLLHRAEAGLVDVHRAGGGRALQSQDGKACLSDAGRRPAGTSGGVALKLSLLGNAVLAVACVLLWGLGRSPSDCSAVERNAVKRWAESFPKDSRIADFDNEAAVLPQYEAFGTEPKFAEAQRFLLRARAYVDFVNERLFENQPAKETAP